MLCSCLLDIDKFGWSLPDQLRLKKFAGGTHLNAGQSLAQWPDSSHLKHRAPAQPDLPADGEVPALYCGCGLFAAWLEGWLLQMLCKACGQSRAQWPLCLHL